MSTPTTPTNPTYNTFNDPSEVKIPLVEIREDLNTRISRKCCSCLSQYPNRYAYGAGLCLVIGSGACCLMWLESENDFDATSIILKLITALSIMSSFYLLYLHQKK